MKGLKLYQLFRGRKIQSGEKFFSKKIQNFCPGVYKDYQKVVWKSSDYGDNLSMSFKSYGYKHSFATKKINNPITVAESIANSRLSGDFHTIMP